MARIDMKFTGTYIGEISIDKETGDLKITPMDEPALEKETGESDEEAFEKWWDKNQFDILMSVPKVGVKESYRTAWLASRKPKD